ncbi:MAG: STAS domain-containing protein [Planctomycetaceae bacterium]
MENHKAFEIEIVNGIAVIQLESHLSNYQGEEFLSAVKDLSRVLTGAEISSVLIDFSRVQYFGSSVLEGLRLLWKELGAGNRQIFLCELSEVCEQIVRLSHFDHVWTIYPTRKMAIAALDMAKGTIELPRKPR